MEYLEIIIPIAAVVFFIYLIIRFKSKPPSSAGGTFLFMSGATDAFLDKDQKKAVEMIVEKNANKKMDEQQSGEPEHKE